jgi:uncharacterized membrane protein YkvA (DUF1232 family)
MNAGRDMMAVGDDNPERSFDSDERLVRHCFWDKLRASLGRVPFLENALAAWYCAIDPTTPPRVRAILLGALAYFILPFDLVPDWLAVVGFTDDAAVLALALQAVRAHMRPDHFERARATLLVEERLAEEGRMKEGQGAGQSRS